MANALSILSAIIAVISLVVSVVAWRKGRAIYGIERSVIRQVRGTADDAIFCNESELNKKLNGGNYTILTFLERSAADSDWEVLLGRIKPYGKGENAEGLIK